MTMQQPCRFFSQTGYCRYGDGCRFSHNQGVSFGPAPPCRYFADGFCAYGDACWYSHESGPTTTISSNATNPGAHPDTVSDKHQPTNIQAQSRRPNPNAHRRRQRQKCFEDELDERAINYGFTEGQVNELLCQGVKPWEADAWDVLDALSSY